MFLSRVTLKPDIGTHTQLGQLLLKRTYGTHQLLWDLFEQPGRDFLYREEIAKEQLDGPAVRGEPIYYLLSPQPPKAETPLFTVQSKPFKPSFSVGQHLSFRLRANPVVSRNQQRHDLIMDEQLIFYRYLCQVCHLPHTGKKTELLRQLLQPKYAGQLHTWLSDYLSKTRYAVETNQRYSVRELLDLAIREAISRRLLTWLTDNPSRQGIFSLATRQAEDDNHEAPYHVPMFEWYGYRAHPLPEKQRQARFFSVELSGELVVHDVTRFIELLKKGIGPAKGFGCGLMLVKPVWSC